MTNKPKSALRQVAAITQVKKYKSTFNLSLLTIFVQIVLAKSEFSKTFAPNFAIDGIKLLL